MKEAWSLYLIAFKNMFDYRNIAERKELNWFFLFMFIFWMLSGMFFMGCCISLAVSEKHDVIPVMFFAFFIYAGIYHIIHGLSLISLVKRRFNLLAPQKSGIFFGSWLGVWLVQLTICINVFLTVKNATGNINPLTILPLAFIGQICGLVVIGTVIFLMIRQKPIA